MTISRTDIPYVTLKNAADAINACFGSHRAAADAIGYKERQLRGWSDRKLLPRPVYDRLVAASPTPFPKFGRTKWVKGGRNFSGPDATGTLAESPRPGKKKRSRRVTQVKAAHAPVAEPIRPTVRTESRAPSPTTNIDAIDPIAAIEALIGQIRFLQTENQQLTAKLTSVRDVLV